MSHNEILAYLTGMKQDFLKTIKTFVELESPSHEDKAASDKCGKFLKKIYEELGFKIEMLHQENCGDHVYGEIGGDEKKVLIVGHYDTVFPIGTLKTMPFRIEEGKAFGPGILDMKSGIIMAFYAIKALQDLNLMPEHKIGIFFNSDEESGSFYSRDLILEKARQYQYVLVMEPGVNDFHSIKTARFGRGTYKITAHGKSAHSGSNPHLAVNPLTELAYQLLKVEKWDKEKFGATLTPTMIRGGIDGTCMVPEDAFFSMDVRFETKSVSEIIHEKIMKMDAITKGARLEVTGAIDKPVMVADRELVKKAKKIGKFYGLKLNEVTVGGGSDGNFTSDAGIPTLDGLGGTGEYLHNPKEYIHIDHFPARTALTASLIQTL